MQVVITRTDSRRESMPWADWTLLSVLGGGFVYGVATLIIRERSLPFIIQQRESAMDFTLREDELEENEELSFEDARKEFEKRLSGLMDQRHERLEKMKKLAAEERMNAEKEEAQRKREEEERLKDALAHEEMQRQRKQIEYEAQRARERAELEAFQERMERQRKEEEERLKQLEEEERLAAIEQEQARQQQMEAMEAQRQMEIDFQSHSDVEAVDVDDKTKKDLEERLNREGAKTGEVQISLMWNDRNDLDLHVLCPSGERIHGGNKVSKCGGELDVDMNVRAESKRPVENVFWEENAPAGEYKAFIHFYKHHKKRRTRTSTTYKLVVNAGGEIKEYSDSITFGEPIKLVAQFTMPEMNQRAGYKEAMQEITDIVRSQMAAASTIEEYEAISLEELSEELAEELREQISRNIEQLKENNAQQEREQRFEETKRIILISTDSEELEKLDLSGFNEYETKRLEELLESNLEVQQAEKFNELMRQLVMAEDFEELDSVTIAGINQEQRESLLEAKDEANERFKDQRYEHLWQRLSEASTHEELDSIELEGVGDEQKQSLVAHKQSRSAALWAALEELENPEDIEEEPVLEMVEDTEIEYIDDEADELEELLEAALSEISGEEKEKKQILDEVEVARPVLMPVQAEVEPEEDEDDDSLAAVLEKLNQELEDQEEEADLEIEQEEVQETSEVETQRQLTLEPITVDNDFITAVNGRLERENAKRGKYEISLMWNNKNDLDLHIDTANGDHIDVNNRFSSCGGNLCMSMNAKTASKKPIEHIIWENKPPTGKYVISVDYFSKKPGFGTRDPTKFAVVINLDGNMMAWQGYINSNDPRMVAKEFAIIDMEEE